MDDYARVEKDGRTGFTKISNTDGEAITISGGLSLGGDQSNDAKRELKLYVWGKLGSSMGLRARAVRRRCPHRLRQPVVRAFAHCTLTPQVLRHTGRGA